MRFLKWSDELGTGIEVIDAQHLEFCRRVNAFLKVYDLQRIQVLPNTLFT